MRSYKLKDAFCLFQKYYADDVQVLPAFDKNMPESCGVSFLGDIQNPLGSIPV